MKKKYIVLIVSLWTIYAGAQNFQWAKREGLNAYDYGYGIGTDNTGNVYIAGKFEQNANFSGTILNCQGNHDIYVAQYSSAGNLNWIRTGGGLNGDYAHAMSCDGSANVYVAGEIEGFGTLITFQSSTITLTAKGDNDVFVSKYDLSGNLLWAKSEGWQYSEKAQGVTYDNAGNVYICGYFTDTTKFNGSLIAGQGYHDMFVAKYDANGNFQWVQTGGGPSRDEALGIRCDAAGNVYVCGMYNNGAKFGTQTLTTTGNYFDAYLAKYSSSGTLLWIKTGGGAYDDVAWSLVLDNGGKIYVAGEFNAYATFGTYALTTVGNADVFVLCYDANGNEQWAKRAGGPLNDRARGIGSDGTGLVITGQFGATAAFGTGNVTAADSSDIFMAALDNAGNFSWVSAVGGVADNPEPLGYESGNAITAEPSGNVYATGALLDGGVFSTYSLSPYSRTDVFLTKLSSAPSTIGIKETNSDKHVSLIYPNPGTGNFTIDLGNYGEQKTDITIYNSLGQIIEKLNDRSKKTNIDLSAQENGIYIIEIRPENGSVLRNKLIVQK